MLAGEENGQAFRSEQVATQWQEQQRISSYTLLLNDLRRGVSS